jgi:hypothetical protein
MNKKFEISSKLKPPFKIITRILAIPTALLAFFIFSDLVSSPSNFDQAKIIDKYTFRRSKGGISYNIKAKGNYSYDEEVSKKFFDTANVEDTINVSLTKLFSEWKTLELIREGKPLIKTTGTDIYSLGIFGLLFLAALLAFLPEGIIFSNLALVISLPLLNFAAIMIWAKLLLVWFGLIGKM